MLPEVLAARREVWIPDGFSQTSESAVWFVGTKISVSNGQVLGAKQANGLLDAGMGAADGVHWRANAEDLFLDTEVGRAEVDVPTSEIEIEASAGRWLGIESSS